MKKTHTPDLLKTLKGFDLFLLEDYAIFMNQEREEDQEYNTGIFHHDDRADFYSWVDMMSYDELKDYIEEYANWREYEEANRK